MFLDILMHLRSTIYTFTGESVDSDDLEKSFNEFLSSWGMSRDTILKLGTFGVLKEMGVGFHVYLDKLGDLGQSRIAIDLDTLKFSLIYSEYLTKAHFTDEEMNEIFTCSCLKDSEWADLLLLSLDTNTLNAEKVNRVLALVFERIKNIGYDWDLEEDKEIFYSIYKKLSNHGSSWWEHKISEEFGK